MNLFIDTNIYLQFYHFTSDDLEELKKLSVAIKVGKISLHVTEQVEFEFKRNREIKIADAFNNFKSQEIANQFPQICKEYSEYDDLRMCVKKYQETKKKIILNLEKDIENNSLGADKTITDLFSKAKKIEITEEIFANAKRRVDIGNPPGKNNSYGDAINWESLLLSISEGEDLNIITEDKDYLSQINSNNLSQFLLDDWSQKKKSKIYFYRKLSDFFRDKFPDITLEGELEKDMFVSKLVASVLFSDTHTAIEKLSKHGDFSDTQINEMVEAALSNSQIRWISGDADVRKFFYGLIEGKENVISESILEKFKGIYKKHEEIIPVSLITDDYGKKINITLPQSANPAMIQRLSAYLNTCAKGDSAIFLFHGANKLETPFLVNADPDVLKGIEIAILEPF